MIPKVSVVIPTHNRAHLLARALQSILRQTYRNIEILVVDDGSTDQTTHTVGSFNDSRIVYIRSAQNKGAAAARNIGINAAEGEFVAFQDSDDEWLHDKLAKQMTLFAQLPPAVGVVYAGYHKVTGLNKEYVSARQAVRKRRRIHRQLLEGNFIALPTVIVRRRCLASVDGFDESLPRLQDWDLFIRLAKEYDFACIDEPLVTAYATAGSISTNRQALLQAQESLFKKYREDIAKDSMLLAHWCYALGSLCCALSEFDSGRALLRRAAKLRPLNVKYVADTLSSALGRDFYYKAIGWRQVIKRATGIS